MSVISGMSITTEAKNRLLGEFSLFGAFESIGVLAALLLIFSLMLADFFDTMGTMTAIGAEAGLNDVKMLLQVHDELVFEVPEGKEEAAARVVREVMARAAEPALKLDVPLDVEVGWGPNWGAAH